MSTFESRLMHNVVPSAVSQVRAWLSMPRVKYWMRVCFSIALLALLLFYVDFDGTLMLVANLRSELFIAAFAMAMLNRIISAYRWYVLLYGKNPGVTFGLIIRLSFTSIFLGMFLPGSIGTEAIRVYALSREISDVHLSFTSVLLERLTGLFVLLLIVVVVLNWAPPGIPQTINVLVWLGLAGLVLGSAALMNQRLRTWIDNIFTEHSLLSFQNHVNKIYTCLDTYKRQKMVIAGSIVTAMITQFVRISVVALCGLSLGLDISLIYFAIFVPIIVLIGMLPISIGGLGVAEATFVFLFSLIGVPVEAAFALGLLFLATNIMIVLPGAWFYVRRGI